MGKPIILEERSPPAIICDLTIFSSANMLLAEVLVLDGLAPSFVRLSSWLSLNYCTYLVLHLCVGSSSQYIWWDKFWISKKNSHFKQSSWNRNFVRRPSIQSFCLWHWLYLKLLHGFLSNFSYGFPWAICSYVFFLFLKKKKNFFFTFSLT